MGKGGKPSIIHDSDTHILSPFLHLFIDNCNTLLGGFPFFFPYIIIIIFFFRKGICNIPFLITIIIMEKRGVLSWV